jgi:putative ABC transport system substrate-binding protein
VVTLHRRHLLATAVALIALPLRSRAQGPQNLRRIAILTTGSSQTVSGYIRAYKESLRERGYFEGRDVEIEIEYAEGREQALGPLAAKLAARKPVVVVAGGAVAAVAARKASPDVPILTLAGDMASSGLVTNFARPDSGTTGVSFQASNLDPKRLESLAALLPKGSAVLNLTDSSARAGSHVTLGETGRSLGVVLHAVEARTPQEIDTAFGAARKLGVAGVNVLTSPFLNLHRARIIKLAAAARLPTIYQWPETAEEGGLLGYGPRIIEIYRQLAGFTSRILQGATPAELPVEQPVKYELVVNMKTARAIGIVVPQSFLLRADRVIE